MNTAKPRRAANTLLIRSIHCKPRQRYFDPLARFGMHTVTIEVLECPRARRHKLLHEAPTLLSYPHFPALIDNLHRQRIEEFVAKDDQVSVRTFDGGFERFENFRAARRQMLCQPLL